MPRICTLATTIDKWRTVDRGLAGTVSWHWFELPSFATHQISLLSRVNGRLPYSPGIKYQIARLTVQLVILLIFIFLFLFLWAS